MNCLNIKKGDTVIVLSGRDKGRKGKVLSVLPRESKVVVEGISIATKHQKSRTQTEQGKIVKMETPIYASKVMRVCPKCNKPTRAAHKMLADHRKVRVCKKCGAEI